MHNDASNVVRMSIPLYNLLSIVDVVNPDAEVIGPKSKPSVLSRDKSDAANCRLNFRKILGSAVASMVRINVYAWHTN